MAHCREAGRLIDDHDLRIEVADDQPVERRLAPLGLSANLEPLALLHALRGLGARPAPQVNPALVKQAPGVGPGERQVRADDFEDRTARFGGGNGEDRHGKRADPITHAAPETAAADSGPRSR
jgi:hypothetical protein